MAIRKPGRFAPRAAGGENRQSAFGKAYQSCSPCLFDPLNRPGCASCLRILGSIEVCRRGGGRHGGGREGPRGDAESWGGGLSRPRGRVAQGKSPPPRGPERGAAR